MNRVRYLVAGFVATLLTACGTPSVNPLYLESDELVQDDALIGVWRASGDTATYEVRGTPETDHYEVVIRTGADEDEPEEWTLEMRLIDLPSGRWADFQPADDEREAIRDRWGPMFVSTHLFARIELEDESLKLWMLRPSWMREALNDDEDPLRTVELDDAILIVDTTERLRSYLDRIAKDEDAFDAMTLRRQQNREADEPGGEQPDGSNGG
ncbi:MAG: hypothetical protein ACF8PN_11735 [Phycisphaerales bacterium]